MRKLPARQSSGRKSRWRCRALPPATRRCARWGAAATTCTIAATTSRTWPRIASMRKWPICWCMANCPTRRSWQCTKQACGLCAACLHRSNRRLSCCQHQRIRWTCCVREFQCWAACGQKRTVTATRERGPSRMRFWRRSVRCCSTGITSRAMDGGLKSRPTTTRSPRIFFT